MDITPALTSVGALGGIAYGVSKEKPFWATAAFAILFGIGGAALGMAVKHYQNNQS